MALSMSAEGKRVNTWTVSAVYKLCFEGLWGCKKRGLVAWKRDSPTLAPLTIFFCRLGFWEKKMDSKMEIYLWEADHRVLLGWDENGVRLSGLCRGSGS